MTKQQDTAETSQQAGVPAGRITNHMANQDQGGGHANYEGTGGWGEWEEQARLRILGSSWMGSFDTPSEITQNHSALHTGIYSRLGLCARDFPPPPFPPDPL